MLLSCTQSFAKPFVPAYLLGRKRPPQRLPASVGLGADNEAIEYTAHGIDGWQDFWCSELADQHDGAQRDLGRHWAYVITAQETMTATSRWIYQLFLHTKPSLSQG